MLDGIYLPVITFSLLFL